MHFGNQTEGRQSHQKYSAVSELDTGDPCRAQSEYVYVYVAVGQNQQSHFFWATSSFYLF